MVKLLLERGANPNFQNEDRRTPMMEAALWGRYENVRHLLDKGADKKFRDSDGFKAIDLAKPSDRNEKERYQRSGGKHQIYKEVAYEANQARRMIVLLLKDNEDEKLPISNQGFERHFFQKSPQGTIGLFAPIAEYSVPHQWKTIARLEREGGYPSVVAMSGWAHGDTTSTVSGRDWTSEVRAVAETVGHALKLNQRCDQGVSGQFAACHAEKQLIAYFVSRHVFLGLESDEGEPLHQLATARPPVMLRKAKILVSYPPCEDCKRFEMMVNLKLGLEISLLDRSAAR